MTINFYYFPIRGRCEVPKLMCAYAKESFKLEAIKYEDQKSDLDAYPYGQSPRMVDEDSGLNLVQSNTMIRHLARKHKLYGAGDADAARVDMVIDGVEDLRMKYVALIYQGKLEEPAKATYWQTHGDKETALGARNGGAHLEYLARLLRKAGGDWFVGAAPTAADFAVFEIVDLHLRPALFPEALKAAYPELAAHHARVEALPGVKEYRAGPDCLPQPNNNTLG